MSVQCSCGEISFTQHSMVQFQTSTHLQQAVEFFGNEMKIKSVANIFYWNSSRFRSFLVSKFQFLFRFSFLDHYNSSSSSLKTTTDNSSSRFNIRNENYTGSELHTLYCLVGLVLICRLVSTILYRPIKLSANRQKHQTVVHMKWMCNHYRAQPWSTTHCLIICFTGSSCCANTIHLTHSRPSVSEMTYTVSSGTLNSSIPYHTTLQAVRGRGPLSCTRNHILKSITVRCFVVTVVEMCQIIRGMFYNVS